MGKVILVVEDDPLLAQAMADVLFFLATRVCTARTGADALRILMSGDGIDLLILDIVLPTGGAFAGDCIFRGNPTTDSD